MYVESWTQLSVDCKTKKLLWLLISGSTSNSNNYEQSDGNWCVLLWIGRVNFVLDNRLQSRHATVHGDVSYATLQESSRELTISWELFCYEVRVCGEYKPCRGRAHQLGDLRWTEREHVVRGGLGRRNFDRTVFSWVRFNVIFQRLSNYYISHPSMHEDLNDFSSRPFKFRKLRFTFFCEWTIKFQIVNQRTQWESWHKILEKCRLQFFDELIRCRTIHTSMSARELVTSGHIMIWSRYTTIGWETVELF